MYTIKNLKFKKKDLGFTLVELLVVVLVISILSGLTLGILNNQGIRAKARDSQRVADLKKIQTALEFYFSDNRIYPNLEALIITGSDALSSTLTTNGYINVMPVDPEHAGSEKTSCVNPEENRYNYIAVSSGGGYVLTAIMDISTTNDDSKCVDLNNWTSSWCSSMLTDDVCYGVENP